MENVTNNHNAFSETLCSAFPRGIHHLDLYRLTGTNPVDLYALEFSKLIKEAITIVEWPERLRSRNIVLDGALWVNIQLSENEADKKYETNLNMTEDMFEEWLSVPRHVTYECGINSPWSTFVSEVT